MSDTDSSVSKPSTPKWKVIVVLLAVIGVFVAFTLLIPKEFWESLGDWIDGLGHWAPVIFVLIYIVASVILVPCSALTLVAGAVFGVVWGTAWVSIGSVLGASSAFLIGRYFARDWVEKKTSGNKNFAAVDKAIESGGFKIVTLIRLSPLFPYNLLNYFFGLTKVRFGAYVLASWIGMFPGTVMYVYIGHLLRVAAESAAKASDPSGVTADLETADTLKTTLTVIGFAVTVVVTIMVTRAAKKALAEQTEVEA